MTSDHLERCLLWLILYAIIVATVVKNAKLVTDLPDIHPSTRSKIHVVHLLMNSSTSKYADDVPQNYDSFFDCHHEKSSCRYLKPGEFYQHYFSSSVRSLANDTSSIEDTQGNSASEQLLEWRGEIGLENENMPALTSLSWWSDLNVSGLNALKSNNQLRERKIEEYIAFPRNLTYIHVHKCGGTSIQSALSRRATQIGNIRFLFQTNEQLEDSDTIKIQADVHHYKHSYGGGSLRKKERWDMQRLNHIKALKHRPMNRTPEVQYDRTAFPIFTILRDPIERFFSAVQQVMHYNVDFRAKCLREPFTPMNEKLAKASRRETIQCAIDDMKETHYRRDVHLLPMSAHFRLLDGNFGDKSGKDIPWLDLGENAVDRCNTYSRRKETSE
eukprot:CCRYP_000296-RB/>CCRYP_000296-RB protein AED:0.44 eAED:0.48 QI:0/0/0/1/0/0/2/0/385